ncbi:hypothetical protein ACF064_00230 [Streptomyces sp. NPDC015492]
MTAEDVEAVLIAAGWTRGRDIGERLPALIAVVTARSAEAGPTGPNPAR